MKTNGKSYLLTYVNTVNMVYYLIVWVFILNAAVIHADSLKTLISRQVFCRRLIIDTNLILLLILA